MNHLRRPLTAACLAYLAGLLLTLRFQILQAPLVSGTALTMVLGAGIWAYRRRRAQLGVDLLGLFIVVGLLAGASGRLAVDADCRSSLPEGGALTIQGRLGAEHRQPISERGAPLLPLLDGRIAGAGRCGGEFRIRIGTQAAPLATGSALQVHGHWRRFDRDPRARWPQDPKFAGFLIVIQ